MQDIVLFGMQGSGKRERKAALAGGEVCFFVFLKQGQELRNIMQEDTALGPKRYVLL